MARKHWGQVYERAWKEATESVGLGTGEKVVVALLGQAFVALLVYLLLGRTALANDFWIRVITAAAPFAMFPLLFVWKAISLAPRMAAEHEAEIESLRSAKEIEERRKALREELGRFVAEGETLMSRCLNVADPLALDQSQSWFDAVNDFLGARMDNSYVARFKSTTGAPTTVPVGAPSPAHEQTWVGVRDRVFRLHEFIRELTPSPSA